MSMQLENNKPVRMLQFGWVEEYLYRWGESDILRVLLDL